MESAPCGTNHDSKTLMNSYYCCQYDTRVLLLRLGRQIASVEVDFTKNILRNVLFIIITIHKINIWITLVIVYLFKMLGRVKGCQKMLYPLQWLGKGKGI